jgi:hypothetical protein
MPDLAFVLVTDLSPSTVAAAGPEGSRSPSIARFLRTAAAHGSLGQTPDRQLAENSPG